MLPKNEALVCPKRVAEYLAYTPDNGEIRWLKSHIPALIGKVAGTTRPYKDGSFYHVINFQRRFILAHRVAWFLHYGEWPDGFIDHINGDKLDNRIVNLRVVTKSENCHNVGLRKTNTTGLTGTVFDERKKKWRARISVRGKRHSLGYFDDKESAAQAYIDASQTMLAGINMRINQ